MKRSSISILVFILIFVFTCTLYSYSQSPKVENPAFNFLINMLLKRDVPEMDIQQFNKETKPLVLLDTRTKSEFEISHIPGSIWVGYEEFDIESIRNIPADAKIISYCSIGYRSEEITRKLQAAGYKNSSNLYGGIFEWVNQEGKLEDMEGMATEKLHVYKRMWGIWTSAKEKVY